MATRYKKTFIDDPSVSKDINPNIIQRITDEDDERSNTSIPKDEDNLDYQEYLKWIAEGNEAEPADEGE